ncbi:MAG: Disulfide bond reductase DsbH [Chlamydiae bacterium]|nr:Disulfide bond reductase DsbH [Chlamydiota bacterium]
MQSIKTIFLFTLSLGILWSSHVCGALSWQTNYPKALTQAKKEERSLLIFFSGSDWSGTGMRMKKEILDSPDFAKALGNQFVFVEVDFPKHSELPPKRAHQNEKLKNRFQIEEYPSLVLIDSSEREILRLGYLPESGAQLGEDLIRIVEQDRKLCKGLEKLPQEVDKLKELYQYALELTRPDALDQVLQVGCETGDRFFLLERYRKYVEDGMMYCQEAKKIRKSLLEEESHDTYFTVALIDFQDLSKRTSKLESRDQAVEPLEEYLSHFKETDRENVWRIEMMMAQFFLETDDWNRALEHAETAFESAPDAMKPDILHSLTYIREHV